MNSTTKNEAFHQRLALLIGTEEPFRWGKTYGNTQRNICQNME